MDTILTSKGQITIPKRIREALALVPGCTLEITINQAGDLVLHRAKAPSDAQPDRFATARGKADVKWRTDELMALLRGED
jgi:AbrB family looped-hinge helix DNA binding protein